MTSAPAVDKTNLTSLFHQLLQRDNYLPHCCLLFLMGEEVSLYVIAQAVVCLMCK